MRKTEKSLPLKRIRVSVKHHAMETSLALIALLVTVLFVIIHLASGVEVWWLLAISTILLALSDLVMRLKE